FQSDDAVLTSGFLDFSNTYRLKVHEYNLNVLFFLPQMDEPFDFKLRNMLLSSPFVVEEMMINWLRDLYDQNRRFELLQQQQQQTTKRSGGGSTDAVNAAFSTFAEPDMQSFNLPIQLPKGSVKEITKRFKHITGYLADQLYHEKE